MRSHRFEIALAVALAAALATWFWVRARSVEADRRVREGELVPSGPSASLGAPGAPGAPGQPGQPSAAGPAGSEDAAGPSTELEDELFLVARPGLATLPLPARYRAPLPASVEALRAGDGAGPPRSHVADGLCRGDPELWQRYLEALRRAASAASSAAALADAYGELLRGCTRPELCARARELVVGGDSALVKAPLWVGLAGCTGTDVAQLFERLDAPAAAVAEFYGNQLTAPAYSPRLAEAAKELLTSDDEQAFRSAAFALGSMDDRRALEALLGLHAAAQEPKRRELVALALGRFDDPRARKLFVGVCRGERAELDPACELGPRPTANKPATMDQLVRSAELGAVLARVAHGASERATVLESAERCLAERPAADAAAPGRDLEDCLTTLACIDRPRAVVQARKLLALPGLDEATTELATGLVAFPEPGALAGRLERLGLLRPGAAPALSAGPATTAPASAPPSQAGCEPDWTALRLLELRGRTLSFDTETDQFPNGHDHRLRALAALAAPALDDVVFEELAPASAEADGRGEPYVLHAYAGGRRYRVVARNLGDWLDVEAVLGLLNALLRDRGSELRFVPLPTGDQTATVLLGPKGLSQAVHEELLVLAPPGAAARAGREFEREVLDQLERERRLRPALPLPSSSP